MTAHWKKKQCEHNINLWKYVPRGPFAGTETENISIETSASQTQVLELEWVIEPQSIACAMCSAQLKIQDGGGLNTFR